MKRGHRPFRTCRGCGRKAPKADLVRWSVVHGEIIEDPQQNNPGRGIYTCAESECSKRLQNNKKILNKVLRLKKLSGKKDRSD